MAQTTIASIRNFQSQRYVIPQFQENKKQRKVRSAACSTLVSNNSGFRYNLSEIMAKTYSIFPSYISFGIGNPLPSLVLKYSQLNSASAGFAKIPVRLAVKYLQSQQSNNVDRFGDDACFILNSKKKDYIGIADGVGGWRSWGYDPSAFASSLLTICKDIAQKKPSQDPYKLIDNSYKKLLILNKQKNFGIIGSSTVCILSFDHVTGLLQTANLGDSGFLLVRNKQILQRSQRQTHRFNTPKQLAYAPPSIRCIADQPSDASQLSVQCLPGDIIITATDGLFDNISEEMILNELYILPEMDEITMKDLDIAAKSLASLARRKATDKSFLSPFSLAAKSAGFNYKGGKIDDITVIVSCVSDLGTEV